MLKLNRKTTLILSFSGSLFSLAALLIFMLLPTSDFANSIEHSAKDALMLFVLSPICSFIGSASFIFAGAKDYSAWVKFTEDKPLVLGLISIFAAFSAYEIILFTAYVAEQFSLGFVAPFNGTVYENLAVVATVFVALKLVGSVLLSIAAVRNK